MNGKKPTAADELLREFEDVSMTQGGGDKEYEALRKEISRLMELGRLNAGASTPDFKTVNDSIEALNDAAELLKEKQGSTGFDQSVALIIEQTIQKLKSIDAGASTGQERAPDGFAYKYPDNTLRFNHGEMVNGSEPVKSMPYWFEPLQLPATTPGQPAVSAGERLPNVDAMEADELIDQFQEEVHDYVDNRSHNMPYVRAELLKRLAAQPIQAAAPGKQRAIDISNLRFCSAMAHDFKWGTNVIHESVVVQTLAGIADRLASLDPQAASPQKWWSAINKYRGELIDKNVAKQITGDEQTRLDALNQFASWYLDLVVPRPNILAEAEAAAATTEKASRAGMCLACGLAIYEGDFIFTGTNNGIPVAIHESCGKSTPALHLFDVPMDIGGAG